jgi:hypothetical protein
MPDIRRQIELLLIGVRDDCPDAPCRLGGLNPDQALRRAFSRAKDR